MSDNVTNLFTHRSAAQRYAAGRPYFHPQVIARVPNFTGRQKVDTALDVACGTGQSAHALAAIADHVHAIDISPEMLSPAQPHERITFHVAGAEHIPFANQSFDLTTVGLAFHWFDQGAFLSEAARVLKPGAWLILYTSGFAGEMLENPDFHDWAWNIHPKNFPTPPRRSLGVSSEVVAPYGFSLAAEEKFAHNETMTPSQLTAYLLTQTNVIASVENGAITLAEAASAIESGMTQYFSSNSATFKFSGSIWFLQNNMARPRPSSDAS